MGQRLGLAAALLGDPHTLILDEPANGLDPQGIQWIRQLLQGFASTGRSVFVSSHLLSEMALMADELVVLGKGRLLASGPVQEFVRSSTRNAVVVRSPQASELADVLRREGGEVTADGPGVVSVTGVDAARIGDLAFEAGIRLHELSPRVATLEEAFLEATESAQEFEAS
jgi:ABC-2 type transport system ATP-binding protein